MSFRRMTAQITGVSGFLGATMLFSALASLLLARHLPQEAFGEFALLRTLVLFIAPLAVWGQDVAVARFFSRVRPELYTWSRSYRNTVSIAAGLVAAGVIAAGFIYQLDFLILIVLAAASLAYVSSLFLANLHRSQQRYTTALAMQMGFRSLFLIAVLVFIILEVNSAAAAVGVYLGLIVLAGLFNIIFTFRRMPPGQKPVPPEMRKMGLLFMGTQMSVTVMGSLDSLFVPGLLDVSSLAVYQAAIVPAQVFQILSRAGKYVWVPEFGRARSLRLRRLSLALVMIAVVGAAVLVGFAEPILHLFYAGKYDNGAPILQVLAMAGAVRLFYSFLSSLIVGRLSLSALQWHLAATLMLMVLDAGMLWMLIQKFGTLGAAYSTLILTVLRTLASVIILKRFSSQLCERQ